MDALLDSIRKTDGRKILPLSERPSQSEAEDAVRILLRWIGEDIDRVEADLLGLPQAVDRRLVRLDPGGIDQAELHRMSFALREK